MFQFWVFSCHKNKLKCMHMPKFVSMVVHKHLFILYFLYFALPYWIKTDFDTPEILSS